MDHDKLKEKLFLMHDGELDRAGQDELRAHMAGCAQCRETYEFLQKLSSRLFKKPVIKESEFFVTRVMARIEALPQVFPQASLWVWRTLTAGFAAAAILLLIVLKQDTSEISTKNLLLAGGNTDQRDELVLTSQETRQDDIVMLALGEEI